MAGSHHDICNNKAPANGLPTIENSVYPRFEELHAIAQRKRFSRESALYIFSYITINIVYIVNLLYQDLEVPFFNLKLLSVVLIKNLRFLVDTVVRTSEKNI